MQAIKIDVNGYFLEDIPVWDEVEADDIVTTPCPGGFFKPRWDGTQWVEGEDAVTLDEKKQKIARDQFKADRKQKVEDIVVTTAAGNSFDGDEASQDRMVRAIVSALDDTETIPWTLADNTVINVNRVELKEALRLAGQTQSSYWQQ